MFPEPSLSPSGYYPSHSQTFIPSGYYPSHSQTFIPSGYQPSHSQSSIWIAPQPVYVRHHPPPAPHPSSFIRYIQTPIPQQPTYIRPHPVYQRSHRRPKSADPWETKEHRQRSVSPSRQKTAAHADNPHETITYHRKFALVIGNKDYLMCPRGYELRAPVDNAKAIREKLEEKHKFCQQQGSGDNTKTKKGRKEGGAKHFGRESTDVISRGIEELNVFGDERYHNQSSEDDPDDDEAELSSSPAHGRLTVFNDDGTVTVKEYCHEETQHQLKNSSSSDEQHEGGTANYGSWEALERSHSTSSM
ncbi:unnamed protein product [Didymodactylos carnosus]|uniref:Uncharacterized protein n=1 Tax=Didymodactylos carnosus TaxID=1234261 RepID=A0A8S2JL24_9BILA|nr:unnamed protein product [Didymodactylos carnosus]CAF3812835.1 unnamed protein product [Didymodactylos carnosus]